MAHLARDSLGQRNYILCAIEPRKDHGFWTVDDPVFRGSVRHFTSKVWGQLSPDVCLEPGEGPIEVKIVKDEDDGT